MELAFAGVHQLCLPVLDFLERLPAPQRDALEVAFGVRGGGAPDRFLVGLAVLTLLAEAAEERPLLCVVDDAQWLDRASAQVLAFVARRLLAEPVGLMFVAREPGAELRGLPDLEVRGLQDEDARALLRSLVRFRLDETREGSHLGRGEGQSAGAARAATRIEPDAVGGRVWTAGGAGGAGAGRGELSAPARALAWRARAGCCWSPPRTAVGDAALVWARGRATGDWQPRPRWPLRRTDCWRLERACGSAIRWCVRRFIARRHCQNARRRTGRWCEVTDRELDPDRRAWHLAAAAPGADEEVAAELERSAGPGASPRRRGRRGGVSAALRHAHERARTARRARARCRTSASPRRLVRSRLSSC